MDAFDKHGVTPLHIACRVGHAHIVKLLLDNRADINRRNYPGRSALHMAATCGQLPVVELLLSRTCDVNAPGLQQQNPALLRQQNEHLAIVDLLKQQGAKE